MVYGPGKTDEHIAAIVTGLLAHNTGPVMVTRVGEDTAAAVRERVAGGEYDAEARLLVWRPAPPGHIALTVAAAGTSDRPVAAEACAVAAVLFLGSPPAFTGPRTLSASVGADLLARAATEHLLDLGHVTVHHLAGPQRWYAARDRVNGWRAALEARRRAVPPFVEGDWSAASGYAAGRELAADPEVTAVFAAGDDMANGLTHALREAGRRVPEDISVVGFDDVPVFAYVDPPLTTVRQPFDAAASEGLRLLIHAIEHPDHDLPPANDPPVELVVRASTAPPPLRTPPHD